MKNWQVEEITRIKLSYDVASRLWSEAIQASASFEVRKTLVGKMDEALKEMVVLSKSLMPKFPVD